MNVAFLDPCVAAAKINALRPPPEPMSMCALYQGAMAKDKRLPIAFGHDADHGPPRGDRHGRCAPVLRTTASGRRAENGHVGSCLFIASKGRRK